MMRVLLGTLIQFLLLHSFFPSLAYSEVDTFSLQHGGLHRTFEVYVPPQYSSSTQVAVILNFHGGTGSSKSAIKESRMKSHAATAGYLAVFPNAAKSPDGKQRWNYGPRPKEPDKGSSADDVDFVRALLRKLEKHYRIDRKRIYATGISNGGMFTYRLGCELADQIAAIAPIAAQVGVVSCRPSRPISVIHFHGTADGLVRVEGGLMASSIPKKIRNLDPVRSLKESLTFFKSGNRCSGESRETFRNGKARCETWNACAERSEVTLCLIEGGGHTWPDGAYAVGPILKPFYKKIAGSISRDINANEQMWQFFKRHPMQ